MIQNFEIDAKDVSSGCPSNKSIERLDLEMFRKPL